MNLHPRDLLVPAIAQKVIFYREAKVCHTFAYLIMGSYPRFNNSYYFFMQIKIKS